MDVGISFGSAPESDGVLRERQGRPVVQSVHQGATSQAVQVLSTPNESASGPLLVFPGSSLPVLEFPEKNISSSGRKPEIR